MMFRIVYRSFISFPKSYEKDYILNTSQKTTEGITNVLLKYITV